MVLRQNTMARFISEKEVGDKNKGLLLEAAEEYKVEDVEVDTNFGRLGNILAGQDEKADAY